MAADGTIIIETEIDDKNAQKELKRLEKQIKSLEEQLNAKKQGRLPLEENLNAVNEKLQEARKQLSLLQDEQRAVNAAMQPGSSPEDFVRAYSDKPQVDAALKQQQSEVEAIQKEWDKANQKLSQYDNKISEINGKLNSAKTEAGEVQKQLAAAGPAADKMASATDKAQKSAGRFATRLKGVVSSALIFTVISQALASLRQWLGRVIKTNEEASAAFARLKGALLTLAQPLLNVIIPALTTFVNIVAAIISKIAGLVSALFGTTAEKSAEAAEGLYNETEAIEGVGTAAKKAGKSLASFDEINQLSGGSETGAGSSAGSGGSGAIEPDFSGFDKSFIEDGLSGVIELFTGVALLALGAILTFSGAHVLLGIGLMAIGALAIWDAISSDDGTLASTLVQTGLNNVLMGIGILVGVIGVLLVVTGHLLLGVGLIISGIALWATGKAAGDEGDFAKNILTRLLEAATVIGPAMGVIGVLLVATGRILLGIGLIISGIALWAAGTTDIDDGASLTETIITILSHTATVVGPFLAMIGILLLFVPGMKGKGIAMIIGGIALLAAGEFLENKELLGKDLKEALTDTLAKVSPFIALIGFLLLFVPGMQATAIGMIVAGIGIFIFTAIVPNWDFILDKIKEIWGKVKNYWNAHIAKYFTKEWWADLGKKMLNGLIGVVEDAINGILRGVSDLVNGVTGLLNIIPGVDIPEVDWGHVTLPRLAQGAVIPPNREFLAVLGDQRSGTNIEAPLSTIEQAVENVMGRMGYGGEQTVILQLDRDQLGKVVYKLNRAESRRIGLRLSEV